MSRLLLMGSGPAHLLVLDALRHRRFPAVEATLVTGDGGRAHWAMVPGFIEGRYRLEEISVDLEQLCHAAGCRMVRGDLAALDHKARMATLTDGTTLAYDVGSVAMDGGAEGGPAYSAGTIDRLLELVGALDRLAAEPRPEPRRVVVIEASETGIELALAARARLDRNGASDVIISLLDGRGELFGGRLPAWSDLVERILAEHDITLRLGTGAAEVGPDFVRLTDGRVQPADLVISSPAPQVRRLFRESGLPVDSHGALLVDDTLQVQGTTGLFGSGDCVTLMTAPKLPRSRRGALRMGKVLTENLACVLVGGEPIRHFRPAAGDLMLLNAGDGRALLLYGPVAMTSVWAMGLKDKLDRRFAARFPRAASGTGAPSAT